MAGFLNRFLGLVDSPRQTSSGSMDNKQNVHLEGSSVHIVSRNQPELCEILLHRFGCHATFEGIDFPDVSYTSKKKKAPAPPSQRYIVDLPSGIRVSVWKADLTTLSVDAVVNAANSQLNHGGGLAAALSKAGGPQIKRESSDYIRRNGPLNTGDAIICSAGSLPCKKLIHAVGPQISHRSDAVQARPQLEKTIRSILDIVGQHQLNTVAIPAISSGLFNYPLADCAHAIVTAVKHYFDRLPKSQLKSFHNPTPVEILLVNHDEPTVLEMEKACRRILGPPSQKSYSQAASSITRVTANTPPITVQIGNVLVMLKKDMIEEQKTDVIVNTTSVTRDLRNGAISQALLQKAGDKMQQEMRHAQQTGRIVVTRPYRLKCQEVYHTFCVEKSRTDVNAKKILFDSVLECLWTAVTHHQKSVAFPAIGTGALGFSGKEVASIMLEAVSDFAPNCKVRLDVHFVIFPSDSSTFKAFEDQMRSLKTKKIPSNVPPASENKHGSSSKKAVTPHISLMGPSMESITEAKKWLTQLLRPSDEVYIQNNFIQHFSDEEYHVLAQFPQDGVSVEEFFSKGHTCLNLSSESQENLAEAVLQVEAMLVNVQKAFMAEEMSEMNLLNESDAPCGRTSVDDSSPEFLHVIDPFKNLPLCPKKVEKVENAALETLFNLKKKQMQCSATRKMYQCIPAQFIDMVSIVGFHAEIAPPEDPDFGEGIYFADSVEKAMKLWKGSKDEYLYFVEAEVLEGSSTRGKPGLILPPVVGSNPQMLHNSVNGGSEVAVIFSGYQALPRYIITCGK